MIGEKILHYQILSKLGQGGMGEVYLALDTKLQRRVALKLLPAEIADQSRRWERFVRETRAVAALNHPNIVTIYAVEEAEGKHFFTMELVAGETLDRLIPPRGLPLPRFFELAVPLAAALAAAHESGITHRDLKPENVMVTREGRVKVLDFGMAKRADGEGESDGTLTEEGTVVGTARYMSPEQASGQPLDHRTDLFSFGIVLFEMATGSYPFRGKNSIQVLSSILRDRPPRPTELRQGLPTRLGALIERCLEKEPEDRPQTAGELREQLEALRVEGEAQDLSPDAMHTWAEPVARQRIVSPSYASGRSTSVPGGGPALAVLPLTDLSGQPDYFVEGLTEELITSVAKIGSLRVISRQSAMRYRGSTKLLPDIARELGVDHVLEGTVMRAGDRVRISLQLLRAEPEQHLWAERFDRELRDVLALQSEVALAVANEIEIKLSAQEEQQVLGAARGVAPEVLESYLEGRHHWARRSAGNLERALSCFQRAIAADPTYAPAHAGLADSLALLGQQKSVPGVGVRARAAARQALALDPGMGEAHASLGFVSYFYEWDWETAERELRRAIELAPNLVTAHHWLWALLAALRRFDEARRSIRRARELDPLAPIVINNLGVHYFLTGDESRAAVEMRRALELEPGFIAAHLGLWQVYQFLGDTAGAARELASGLRVMGQQAVAGSLEERVGELGYGAAMEAVADELQRASGPTPPLEALAWMYLANDNRIKALGLLQKALERRSSAVVWLGVAPGWRPLHDEPRYWEVLEQLRLPAPPR